MVGVEAQASSSADATMSAFSTADFVIQALGRACPNTNRLHEEMLLTTCSMVQQYFLAIPYHT
jgi:hypothetical protein